MKGDSRLPDPEFLAAYLDGELEEEGASGHLRQQVQEWLNAHPEAAAEVQAHQQLRHFWESTTPAEPAAETWAALGQRLAHALETPSVRPARRWGWIAGVAIAASLLLSVWLGLSLLPAHHQPEQAASEDVLPVATSAEVEILRVRGNDTAMLVVGELPLHGPLVLAEPGEVSLIRNPPGIEEGDLEVRMGHSQRPMIWAPLEHEREE